MLVSTTFSPSCIVMTSVVAANTNKVELTHQISSFPTGGIRSNIARTNCRTLSNPQDRAIQRVFYHSGRRQGGTASMADATTPNDAACMECMQPQCSQYTTDCKPALPVGPCRCAEGCSESGRRCPLPARLAEGGRHGAQLRAQTYVRLHSRLHSRRVRRRRFHFYLSSFARAVSGALLLTNRRMLYPLTHSEPSPNKRCDFPIQHVR